MEDEQVDKLDMNLLLREIRLVVQEETKPIKEELSVLKQDFKLLRQDVNTLKEDVSELKENVNTLKHEVEKINYKLDLTYNQVVRNTETIEQLRMDVDAVEKVTFKNWRDVQKLKDVLNYKN